MGIGSSEDRELKYGYPKCKSYLIHVHNNGSGLPTIAVLTNDTTASTNKNKKRWLTAWKPLVKVKNTSKG